jgi:hypothetical protein
MDNKPGERRARIWKFTVKHQQKLTAIQKSFAAFKAKETGGGGTYSLIWWKLSAFITKYSMAEISLSRYHPEHAVDVKTSDVRSKRLQIRCYFNGN